MVSKEELEKNGSLTTSIHFYYYNTFRIDKSVKDVHIIDGNEELV